MVIRNIFLFVMWLLVAANVFLVIRGIAIGQLPSEYLLNAVAAVAATFSTAWLHSAWGR